MINERHGALTTHQWVDVEQVPPSPGDKWAQYRVAGPTRATVEIPIPVWLAKRIPRIVARLRRHK